MGNNLPPGVSPGDPDAPWNEPPATVCDTCGAEMHSPADHKDGCSDAPWNDACTCDVDSRVPKKHDRGCRYFTDNVDCMVCMPPHNSTDLLDMYDDLSRLPFCPDHGPDDLRKRWQREAEIRDDSRREDRLQEGYDGPD